MLSFVFLSLVALLCIIIVVVLIECTVRYRDSEGLACWLGAITIIFILGSFAAIKHAYDSARWYDEVKVNNVSKTK